MAGTNTTGRPDEIDSTDYVMTIIRAIRRFPEDRKKEVESYKLPEEAKGSNLQQEKAYRQGYLDALKDMDSFIKTTSRGI